MGRPPMHATGPREALDRGALIAAFAIGALGTVLMKLNAAPVVMSAVYPVIVLVGYVGVSLLSRTARLEPETVGDNCYYLGFLFTLTSLAVTLYQIRDLTGTTGGAEDLIPQVISGFGIALTSTIVGVFLRILLLQFRPDIVARDREARRELAEGARAFRAAIGEATRGLKSVAVETAQRTAERNARLDAVSDGHAARLAEMEASQSQRMQEMLETFARGLSFEMTQAMRAETRTALEPMREAAVTLAASMVALAEAHRGQAGALAEGEAAYAAASARFVAAMETHARAATDSYDRLAARSAQVTAQMQAILDALMWGAKEWTAAVDAERRRAGRDG